MVHGITMTYIAKSGFFKHLLGVLFVGQGLLHVQTLQHGSSARVCLPGVRVTVQTDTVGFVAGCFFAPTRLGATLALHRVATIFTGQFHHGVSPFAVFLEGFAIDSNSTWFVIGTYFVFWILAIVVACSSVWLDWARKLVTRITLT